MGLFRNAMKLLRGRAGKEREEEAAELPTAQAGTEREEPAPELTTAQAGTEREEPAPELPTAQAEVVKAQPVVADREVKRETRPDPNKPGWGLTIGQEIGKARGAALATNKDE